MKKERSKREHGPTFCFNFWLRFGDHRAIYHIPTVITPTLYIFVSFPKTAADSFSKASSKAFAHKSVNNRIQGAEMKLKLKVYLVRLKLHFWP